MIGLVELERGTEDNEKGTKHEILVTTMHLHVPLAWFRPRPR